MENHIKSNKIKSKSAGTQEETRLLDEMIIKEYLTNKQHISSKKLDQESITDIHTLANSIKNLSGLEKRFFIELLSLRIESYLTDLVDKKIKSSLVDIL